MATFSQSGLLPSREDKIREFEAQKQGGSDDVNVSTPTARGGFNPAKALVAGGFPLTGMPFMVGQEIGEGINRVIDDPAAIKELRSIFDSDIGSIAVGATPQIGLSLIDMLMKRGGTGFLDSPLAKRDILLRMLRGGRDVIGKIKGPAGQAKAPVVKAPVSKAFVPARRAKDIGRLSRFLRKFGRGVGRAFTGPTFRDIGKLMSMMGVVAPGQVTGEEGEQIRRRALGDMFTEREPL